MKTKSGFTIIEAIIIVVVAGVVTALGLTFYHSMTATQKATDTAQTAQAQPITITKAADLDTATTDLDQLDIDDSDDGAQLEQQQAAF